MHHRLHCPRLERLVLYWGNFLTLNVPQETIIPALKSLAGCPSQPPQIFTISIQSYYVEKIFMLVKLVSNFSTEIVIIDRVGVKVLVQRQGAD